MGRTRVLLTEPGHLYLYTKIRSLFLHGQVNDSDGEISMLCGLLTFLANEGDEPIRLYVNSQGGCPDDAMALLDAITRCPVPVDVIGHGIVYSAACDLLALSPEGHRFATPRTLFMFHPLKYATEYDTIEGHGNLAKFEEALAKRKRAELAKRLGMRPGAFTKKIRDAWWFEATEAKERNVIDGIWPKGA